MRTDLADHRIEAEPLPLPQVEDDPSSRTQVEAGPPWSETAPAPVRSRRVARLRARRRTRWQAVAVGVAVFLAGSAVAFGVRAHLRPGPQVAGPTIGVARNVVWAVEVGPGMVETAVASSAPGRVATVVALPADVHLGLPGGGPDAVGEAAGGSDVGLLIAAAQASLGVRVERALVTSGQGFAALVDKLGGIEVVVEAPFTSGRRTVPAGEARLSGSEALAYIAAGSSLDREARWEEVLRGLFAGRAHPSAWSGDLGSGTDASDAAQALGMATGGQVIALPTVKVPEGPPIPDHKAVLALAGHGLAGSGTLFSVAVINDNGRPGMGAAVASLLAPAGYRVVAAQNGRTFGLAETKVVADDAAAVGVADQVRDLLGLGRVYVGDEPTGLAEVTIVVGKDFAGS